VPQEFQSDAGDLLAHHALGLKEGRMPDLEGDSGGIASRHDLARVRA
jgi:hypothetical protein